jgi:predicted membrane protein (TIGR00267 family)
MDIGPSIRRFFINTLFDSTFTLLGVIVSSAFVTRPEIEVILGTMITISLGLGISSGASVYQAESLEREREVHELEKAMLTSLSDTKIMKSARNITIIVATVNLLTPFLVCALYICPIAFSYVGYIGISLAAWISIAIALITLLIAGIIVGRKGKGNALLKGIKMAALGAVTFLIGYLIRLLL